MKIDITSKFFVKMNVPFHRINYSKNPKNKSEEKKEIEVESGTRDRVRVGGYRVSVFVCFKVGFDASKLQYFGCCYQCFSFIHFHFILVRLDS